MDRSEALRAIHEDHLDYIQCKVQVDFDNRLQQPVTFRFSGRTYEVNKVVGNFKMHQGQPANGYLVEDKDKNVFFLYTQLEKIGTLHIYGASLLGALFSYS